MRYLQELDLPLTKGSIAHLFMSPPLSHRKYGFSDSSGDNYSDVYAERGGEPTADYADSYGEHGGKLTAATVTAVTAVGSLFDSNAARLYARANKYAA